jgi:predicted nuclease of predicted toxin-antitoxin system
LTLPLYLDDCAFDRDLRRVLQTAGHTVVVPADAGLTGADDEAHFAYVRAHGLVLVTFNADDFIALHERTSDHPGIFLIYSDNDVTRDMTNAEVVRAIANVLAAGVPIAGHVHPLNHWRS